MSRTIRSAAVLTVLASAAWAQAGPLWGYRSPSNSSVLSPGAAAGLTFPNTPWADGPAGGRITATPVESWSVAPAGSPDRVTGAAYTFDLELKDYASGLSGVLNFGGTLDGSIWKTGADLSNAFTGPTTGTLGLGPNVYTVTLDTFDPPTGFGDGGAGRITADVSIHAADGATEAEPGAPAQTPEPSGALLGALAVAVGTGWRQLWGWVTTRRPANTRAAGCRTERPGS